MPSSRRTSAYAWAVVALLWVVACLNYLDRLMVASLRESLKADIAMTEAQFGLLTSVFLWVYGALSPLGGFVADRFSRKWVIIGSLAIWSAVTWATGHVDSFEAMFISRALMGVSEAFYIPAGLAMIADYHQGATRSRAVGWHMSGVYAGAALGGLGGYIADYAGWRYGFTWFGGIGVFYAVVLLVFLRDCPVSSQAAVSNSEPAGETKRVSVAKGLAALFGQRSFLILVAYFSLFALANWGINGWLPTYLREQFNLGQGKAGLSATGYIQIASFIGVLVGGAWSDAWARRNARGRLYVPLIGFCVGGPFLFLMASTDVFLIAIVGMLVYGLGRGFSDTSTMPILCQVVDRRYRATGYGFLNMFSTFVGGAMIYVAGAIRDAHLDLSAVFRASAAFLVLAGLLLLLVNPKRAGEED